MATLKFDNEAARRLEIFYAFPDMRSQRDEAMRRLAPMAGEGGRMDAERAAERRRLGA